MSANIQRILAEIRQNAKSSHVWTRGQPAAQPVYTYVKEPSGGVWRAQEQFPLRATASTRFSVLSWNIDFMRPWPSERMLSALTYLRQYTSSIGQPKLIMLNEMLKSDLLLIQAQDWIRQDYHLTDLTDEFWESGYYGTCVLVQKSLAIKKVFRVHYSDTAMERDALFIDMDIGGKIVRCCSTHLESLVAVPPKRPHQMAEAASFLHEAEAGVLGGDLNAIEDFDEQLHQENGLKDGYLETNGVLNAESGMTWGQMASTFEREKFGLTRMDKLLYCGTVDLESFRTFGMDVVVEDQDIHDDLVKNAGIEKGWVTDHLGVHGEFVVLESSRAVL